MEEIRKIIRETFEEIVSEQRYVVEVDFYVWANSDEEAKIQAKAIASEIDAKYDNRASVKKLGTKPFGAGNFTPVDFD